MWFGRFRERTALGFSGFHRAAHHCPVVSIDRSEVRSRVHVELIALRIPLSVATYPSEVMERSTRSLSRPSCCEVPL